MKGVFEILVPLVLIIVLLMCMMNNNTEEYFSVGGVTHGGEAKCHHNLGDDGDGFKVGGQCKKEHFKVGGQCKKEHFKVGANLPGNSGNSKCDVTMVWANWCGYSNKAKPEYDSLMEKYNGKVIDGCVMNFDHAEEKEKPEIVKKFQTTGFPTYYVSVDGKKHEEFNSIKEDDMLSKIKSIISKHKGSGSQNAPKPAPNKLAPNKPAPNKPAHNKPAPNKPAHNKPAPNKPSHNKPGNYAKAYNSARPTVHGEMLYSSCNDSEYGPVRLDSVSRNLAGIGNSPQEVIGYGDCTELEFAPIKFSTGGPQIPSMNSLKPSLGQLPAPHIDGVQGITRPLAFNSPNGKRPSANGKRPSANGNGNSGNSKKARVTMVRADWCGFCKKAMPEWEKLKGEIHDKVVNGYHMVLRDLEQKRDEGEIKKDYSDVNGFPTYVVEVQGPDGKFKKSGTFNSIEKNDMHEKIKKQLQ